MKRDSAQLKLAEIKTSAELREAFIAEQKPFIYKVASQSSKRIVRWENDEVLSVALIAFNEAIDQYQPGVGTFWGFARMVMQRRIIDYYRQEVRHQHLLLAETTAEVNEAEQQYQREQLRVAQQQEIAKLTEDLQEFKISFQDLVNNSPSHRDTRANLKAAAETICQDELLLQYILTKHKLPLRQLEQVTAVSKKSLKMWRKYLLALILIGSKAEYSHLRSFIGMKRGK